MHNEDGSRIVGGVYMAHIESFSTIGLDPRRKLAFWNDRASESFSPLVSEPEDIRVFNGSIVRGSIGDMTLAEVYSDAQIVRHSRSHVARTKDAMFFLHLQLEGESISRQDGRESLLRVGDFTLCDSTRRYEMVFNGANRMLVLGIPNTVLRRQVGCPESLAAIHMPGTRGTSGLLSQLLRKYWSEYHSCLDEHSGARVAVAILDLIGAAYADVPQALGDRSSLGTAHRIRTVTAIAFDYGFNSPTHFGRVFRAKFNVTPREYRREKAGIA